MKPPRPQLAKTPSWLYLPEFEDPNGVEPIDLAWLALDAAPQHKNELEDL